MLLVFYNHNFAKFGSGSDVTCSSTMAPNMRVYVVFLICVLCASSGESIPLKIAHLSSLNSVDVEEGERIFLNCQGEELTSDMFIIWKNSNNRTLTTVDRFSVEPSDLVSRGDGSPNKQNTLEISPVQGSDRGVYRCLVVQNTTAYEYIVLRTVEVTINVFTFPDDTSPECSGPTTLLSGDVLSLRCESSPGYPKVNLTITSMNVEFRDEHWNTEIGTDGGLVRRLDLAASLAHDGVVIFCNITSTHFPSKKQSCIFGPISVQQRPLSVTQSLTTRLNSLMLFDPVESTTAHSKDLPTDALLTNSPTILPTDALLTNSPTVLPTDVLPTDSPTVLPNTVSPAFLPTVSQTAALSTVLLNFESVRTQESPVTEASTEIMSESATSSFSPFHTSHQPIGTRDAFRWFRETVVSFTVMLVIIIVLLIKNKTSRVGAVGQSHPTKPRIIYVSAISPV